MLNIEKVIEAVLEILNQFPEESLNSWSKMLAEFPFEFEDHFSILIFIECQF